MPEPVASPSCSTPQWPSSITTVSTTAIGQDRNVLVNTATMTTSTAISQRMSMLLARFRAKLPWARTTLTPPSSTPYHMPSFKPER